MRRPLPTVEEARAILAYKRTRPVHRPPPRAGRALGQLVKTLDARFGQGVDGLKARWREVVGDLLSARTEPVQVAAAGFLLARCAGKDKYFFVTDAIYRAQDQIYEPGTDNMRSNAGHDVLLPIAQSAGLTPDQFTKCLSDDAATKALNDRIEKSFQKDGVESTPTFIVNGKKLSPGEKTLAQLDAVIQPLLK